MRIKEEYKGKTIITGKLGDVMQESIHAAMSVVRSRAKKLGIAENFYEKNEEDQALSKRCIYRN